MRDGLTFALSNLNWDMGYGIWLVTGMLPRLTRLATISLFVLFGGVSLYKAFSGEASCGCFGAVQVNPWWTATLDVTIIMALFCCRKVSFTNHTLSLRRVAFVVALWVVLGGPILYIIGMVEKNVLSTLGTEFIGADGRHSVLLEPEKWVNNEFPLLSYIEPPEVRNKLKSSEWTVVLYHHDCPKCRKLINDLAVSQTQKVVCIEVPPYGSELELPEHFVSAKLAGDLLWFGETPCSVVLSNGICVVIAKAFL